MCELLCVSATWYKHLNDNFFRSSFPKWSYLPTSRKWSTDKSVKPERRLTYKVDDWAGFGRKLWKTQIWYFHRQLPVILTKQKTNVSKAMNSNHRFFLSWRFDICTFVLNRKNRNHYPFRVSDEIEDDSRDADYTEQGDSDCWDNKGKHGRRDVMVAAAAEIGVSLFMFVGF